MRAYDIYGGQSILERYTHLKWCPIPTRSLGPHMCAATVMSKFTTHSLTPDICFIPQGMPQVTSHAQFLSYLTTARDNVLPALPAIKYDLDGIDISLGPSPFKVLGGMLLVEGTAGLTGDMIIKANTWRNHLTLSINDIRTLNMNAQLARNDFIQSLKIKTFNMGSKPSFSIGSSLSDKLTLISTSMNIEGLTPNETKITVGFIPTKPIEIISYPLGMTLEIQMGYQFSGTATFYPTSPLIKPQPHGNLSKIMLGLGIVGGAVILTILTAGSDILVGGLAAGAITAY